LSCYQPQKFVFVEGQYPNGDRSIGTSKYRPAVLSVIITNNEGRLCGLVVRVPGYRSRDIGFDSRRYQIFGKAVGLEPVPLSLVRITEELLE
jgi:hypothetical protein